MSDEKATEGFRPSELETGGVVDVKVGAFVLLCFLIAVAVVLLIGARSHVFASRVVLHAAFSDVQGLQTGAPVRLSGVVIGTVSRIAFSSRVERRVHVDLQITRDALARIGEDSIARIGSQGLLGDKIVDINLPTATARLLRAGDTINTTNPVDLNLVVDEAIAVLDEIRVVARNIAELVAGVATPETVANLRSSIASIRQLLHAAEHGPGIVHTLFYDPSTVEKFDALLERIRQLSDHLDDSARQVEAMLHTSSGEGPRLLDNVSRAAREVGDAAAEVHRSEVMQNLGTASRDLVSLLQLIKSGEGTLGALVVDPTVYDQLVTILGGIERSRVLRALVRFAIARDEGAKSARAIDEPPGTPPTVHPSPADTAARRIRPTAR